VLAAIQTTDILALGPRIASFLCFSGSQYRMTWAILTPIGRHVKCQNPGGVLFSVEIAPDREELSWLQARAISCCSNDYAPAVKPAPTAARPGCVGCISLLEARFCPYLATPAARA